MINNKLKKQGKMVTPRRRRQFLMNGSTQCATFFTSDSAEGKLQDKILHKERSNVSKTVIIDGNDHGSERNVMGERMAPINIPNIGNKNKQ